MPFWNNWLSQLPVLTEPGKKRPSLIMFLLKVGRWLLLMQMTPALAGLVVTEKRMRFRLFGRTLNRILPRLVAIGILSVA